MKLQTRKRPGRRAAFTLMEVLIVVAIIVVLASLATVAFRALSDSKEDITRVKMKTVERALVQYKTKHGSYPQTLQLLANPLDNHAAYLEAADLLDAWGNPFSFNPGVTSPTGKPEITSTGDPDRPGNTLTNFDQTTPNQ
jgi:general secretion pathway protein G